MKKRVLLSVTMMLFIFSATIGQGLHYGVKADLNLFKINGNGITSAMNLGGRFGVFATYDFTKKWGLQPELLFSQASAKRGDDFSVYYVYSNKPDANKNIKLSYITIPVLLRYNINRLFTINAGPQYSFLCYDNENLLLNNRPAFKRNDFGLAVGVTLSVDNFNFFGRYVYGLSNVNNIDDRYEWKTQQAQIGIGVKIK
ncbi:outer membrane protein with beta-barrel domain [Chitinophaga niastensis]|uniref:Outer membrane protein with beta-barrel domain n=1 Tax=Chitinophaga niastensis TaxID=536980 RepID=A0A2P8HGM8_CHINA|nr:porin family protein [Chitinophaga niastensis]PSL45372.1 outer membrane protein with beta-barrel domain [Chitinophaga niastensis]